MFGLFNRRKKKVDEVNIKDALDQMRGELCVQNLHLRKELYNLTKYFNKVPFLYSIIDYETKIIRHNDLMKNNLCQTKLLGYKLIEYTHPDDIKSFSKFLKNIRNGNCSNKETSRLISKDGRLSYIRWSGVHLEEDQMVMIFGQDITHEIELGDELKKFIEYKNLVLDNYPGSVVCTDLSGTITEFNRSAEINSGYDRSYVIHKKHMLDIFPNKNIFKDDKLGQIHKVSLKRFDSKLVDSYLLLLPLNKEDKMIGYFGIWHGEEYINYVKKSIE